MVNVGSLMAEIGSGIWGTPANFNGFRVLTSLNEGQPNFARCMAVSCAGTLYYTLSAALAPNGILQALSLQVMRSPILAALLHGTPV